MGETEINAEEVKASPKRKYSRKKKTEAVVESPVVQEEPVVVIKVPEIKHPEHLAPAGKSLFTKEVQRFLGLENVTGVFDEATKEKLSLWQRKKGLEVTGTMTLETKRRMGLYG